MQVKNKNIVKEYVVLVSAMLIVASAIYFFMMPGNVVVGSVSGLAMVLVHLIPVPMSVMTFFLNVLCLAIGFLLVGKEFGAKTVCCTLLLPLYLYIFEMLFPNNQSLTDDAVLDALCFIVIVSVGQSLLFNENASSGGLDIIAKVLNKYFRLELGTGVAVVGMLTVMSAMLVYDTRTLVIGLLATYFNGIVLDEYVGGFARKKKISIISDHTEELRQYIINDIKRGATMYTARGGYDKQEKQELVTILNKNEYAELMKYIQRKDLKVFVTVSTVSEVIGIWNTKARRRQKNGQR